MKTIEKKTAVKAKKAMAVLDEFDPSTESSKFELEDYLRTFYEFRYNVVTGRVFYKPIADLEFVEMGDYHFNSILRRLKENNIPCTKTELQQLLISDFTPKYDPFAIYLQSLPGWDQTTDYITQWADTVQTTNQELWHRCFKRWVVALAGSLKDAKTVNQTAPVFCGGQGVGKTRWIGKLLPTELVNYFFTGTINMSNKDSITQLAECIIIDMDELENLSKNSIGDLKSLMTRQHIRIRRPYGKVAENLPRRASFIGSINNKEFLKDETGSRRFLCFEIKSIDSNHSLDVNLFYSQAQALYDDGFQFWFEAEEIDEVQKNNEQFKKSSFEEEVLMNHFSPCKEKDASDFLTATQIAQILRTREKLNVSNSTVQRVGKALAGKKFMKLKKSGRYVWAVYDKKPKGRKVAKPLVDISM